MHLDCGCVNILFLHILTPTSVPQNNVHTNVMAIWCYCILAGADSEPNKAYGECLEATFKRMWASNPRVNAIGYFFTHIGDIPFKFYVWPNGNISRTLRLFEIHLPWVFLFSFEICACLKPRLSHLTESLFVLVIFSNESTIYTQSFTLRSKSSS